MTGETLDADEIAEEILFKYNMAYDQPMTPAARERLRIVVVQVLLAYGATQEPQEPTNA